MTWIYQNAADGGKRNKVFHMSLFFFDLIEVECGLISHIDGETGSGWELMSSENVVIAKKVLRRALTHVSYFESIKAK